MLEHIAGRVILSYSPETRRRGAEQPTSVLLASRLPLMYADVPHCIADLHVCRRSVQGGRVRIIGNIVQHNHQRPFDPVH